MHNRPLADASLLACPGCDLVQRLPVLEPGASARCPRCDEEIRRRRPDSLERTLALTVAAAVAYVIANTTPMLGLAVAGRTAFTTVVGGAERLWNDGLESVAVLVLFTAVIAPALQLGFMLAVVLGARREPIPRWVGTLLRHHPVTTTWAMVEVMLLGVLVALTKIADYATVVPGIALFALTSLVFLIAAIQANFDPHEIWDRIEWAEADDAGATRAAQTQEGVS